MEDAAHWLRWSQLTKPASARSFACTFDAINAVNEATQNGVGVGALRRVARHRPSSEQTILSYMDIR
jgi:hypothetical protein